MDGSSPSLCPVLDDSDDSDEPQTPVRSSSRLDFCMGDPEEDDSPTRGMDWSSTTFRNDCSYTFIGDTLAVDIALPDPPHLLIMEGDKDDSPRAPDSHTNQDTDAPPLFFASPDPMDQVVFEPQSPIPVRPPSVQIQAEAQESHPPSRIVTQRPNYAHHGFSRSALLHQKTFWNLRHEEWQSRMQQGEVQQESKTNDAYTGLAVSQPCAVVDPPPYMRSPPSGMERDLTPRSSRKREQDIHAPIYPRVGDISALRDPYSVNIDRSFFKLPLWTLHKTLYAFDMQQRIVSPSTSAYDAANFQVSTSSSTLSSYSSSTSGDDEESDFTLVDDSPVPKGPHLLEPSKDTSSPNSPTLWNPFGGWDLSWYARWDLLVGIFQDDPTKYDAFNASTKPEVHLEPKSSPPSPIRRIFRFTVGDEDDYEDEDDYGMPIADSSFSVGFDEECERALAFYNRELK